MTDAVLFQEVAAEYGGRPWEASPRMIANLRLKGLSEPVLAYLSGYLLGRSADIGGTVFYAKRRLLDVSPSDWRPNVREDGLFVVGSCPNGDYIAVDVRDRLGEVGYFPHETGWRGREDFVVVAPGLGALAAGLAESRLPVDYHWATWGAKSGGKDPAAGG